MRRSSYNSLVQTQFVLTIVIVNHIMTCCCADVREGSMMFVYILPWNIPGCLKLNHISPEANFVTLPS